MRKRRNFRPTRVVTWFARTLAVALCMLAALVLWHLMQTLNLGQVIIAVQQIGPRRILFALGLTTVSFAALGTYDVLAAYIIAPHVSTRLAWLAGAVGNAVSNTLGFHAVMGPTVRQRFYVRAGLGWADTARIMSLSWAALGLGFATVLAAAFLVQGEFLEAVSLLSVLGALLYWLGHNGRTVPFVHLTLPSAAVAAGQMILGGAEMAAAIGALYVLMPTSPPFAIFAAAYIGAVVLGIISHAPGGIGVFEAAMLSLSGSPHRASILAALLLYRLVYNLVPFALGVLALAGFEAIYRVNSKAGSTQ
jgi:phosphatidylglycerol lysyltransferase